MPKKDVRPGSREQEILEALKKKREAHRAEEAEKVRIAEETWKEAHPNWKKDLGIVE